MNLYYADLKFKKSFYYKPSIFCTACISCTSNFLNLTLGGVNKLYENVNFFLQQFNKQEVNTLLHFRHNFVSIIWFCSRKKFFLTALFL